MKQYSNETTGALEERQIAATAIAKATKLMQKKRRDLEKVDVQDTNLLAAIAHITHKRCGTLIGANTSLTSSSSLASKVLCCNFYC